MKNFCWFLFLILVGCNIFDAIATYIIGIEYEINPLYVFFIKNFGAYWLPVLLMKGFFLWLLGYILFKKNVWDREITVPGLLIIIAPYMITNILQVGVLLL